MSKELDPLPWNLSYHDLDIIGNVVSNQYKDDRSLYNVSIRGDRIDDHAFANCNSLKSVTCIDVKRINAFAFFNCPRLQTIDLGSSIKYLSNNIFNSCANLSAITLPSTITHLSSQLFNQCWQLLSINIDCKTIPKDFLKNRITLRELVIGTNVCEIGASAFEGCTRLKVIKILEPNIQKKYLPRIQNKHVVFSKTPRDSDSIKKCEMHVEPIRISKTPNSICTSNSSSSKSDSPNVNNFNNLNDLVIHKFAFNNCGVQSIVLPRRVKFIGDAIFKDCTELKTFICQDTLLKTVVNDTTFINCISLNSIGLLDYSVFNNTSYMTITVDDFIAYATMMNDDIDRRTRNN